MDRKKRNTFERRARVTLDGTARINNIKHFIQIICRHCISRYNIKLLIDMMFFIITVVNLALLCLMLFSQYMLLLSLKRIVVFTVESPICLVYI